MAAKWLKSVSLSNSAYAGHTLRRPVLTGSGLTLRKARLLTLAKLIGQPAVVAELTAAAEGNLSLSDSHPISW